MQKWERLIAFQDGDGQVYLGLVSRTTIKAEKRLFDVDVIADGVCRSSTTRSVRVT